MNGAGYAITVSFQLAAGQREAFLKLVRENAATSLEDEPDCQRFDVLLPEVADEVFLYEIYTNRAAFDAHLASPHFKTFDAAVKEMVTGKKVAEYRLLGQDGQVDDGTVAD